MTIYPLFRDARFDPEHIAIMSRVFEEVTVDFGLVPREDGVCRLVAEAIIHCAERGVRSRLLRIYTMLAAAVIAYPLRNCAPHLTDQSWGRFALGTNGDCAMGGDRATDRRHAQATRSKNGEVELRRELAELRAENYRCELVAKLSELVLGNIVDKLKEPKLDEQAALQRNPG